MGTGTICSEIFPRADVAKLSYLFLGALNPLSLHFLPQGSDVLWTSNDPDFEKFDLRSSV